MNEQGLGGDGVTAGGSFQADGGDGVEQGLGQTGVVELDFLGRGRRRSETGVGHQAASGDGVEQGVRRLGWVVIGQVKNFRAFTFFFRKNKIK